MPVGYESVRCSYLSVAAAPPYLYLFICLIPSLQDKKHTHSTHHVVNNTARFITSQKCNFSHFLVRCRVFNLLMFYEHTRAHTQASAHIHQTLCRRLELSLWSLFSGYRRWINSLIVFIHPIMESDLVSGQPVQWTPVKQTVVSLSLRGGLVYVHAQQ